MTGRAAGGGTHAAQFSRWELGRRFVPAKQPVMKPARRSAGDPSRLTASLRAAHRCVSVGIHPVFLPHAPRQPGASPASALTRVPPPAVHRVVSRRSSLRFGRNTPGPVLPVGAPPSRALSAGRLASLRAHVGPPPAVHHVASRRSSLRFGRNTPGIPPSRALSAGRLTGLGAPPGSTAGHWRPGTRRAAAGEPGPKWR